MNTIVRNETEEIIKLYINGISTKKLARKYQCSDSLISKIIKENNIQMRTASQRTQKYSINENAFGAITEESAYWIGFLMADGCIKTAKGISRTVALEITESDKNHIEKFRDFLKSNHKISFRQLNDKRNGWENSKPLIGISFCNQQIIKDLALFGVVPAKSKIAKVQHLENHKDFWRGLIDGDGCITSIHKGRLSSIEIGGSRELLQQFSEYVGNFIFKHKSNVRLSSKCINFYKITFSGSSASKIIEHLYKNVNIFLDRKYKRANHVMMTGNGYYGN